MRLTSEHQASEQPQQPPQPQQQLTGRCQTVQLMRQIVQVASQQEAFFMFDQQALMQNVAAWTAFLPNVTPVFDIGCNCSQLVLAALDNLGVYFNVQNKKELEVACRTGLDVRHVTFGSPVKVASHLRAAAQHGIHRMAFDSLDELHKIAAHVPKAQLLLKLTATNAGRRDSHVAQLTHLTQLLSAAAGLGLPVVGVQVLGHSDTDCAELMSMVALIKLVINVAVNLGHRISHIDLGNVQPVLDAASQGHGDQGVLTKLSYYLASYLDDNQEVKLFGHANHFIVESAFTLAAKVIGKRVEPSTGIVSYVINDGIFGAFGRLMHDEDFILKPEPLFNAASKAGDALTLCNIYGPTGHDLDQVCSGHHMSQVDVGGWLLFDKMGAFAISYWATQSSQPHPATTEGCNSWSNHHFLQSTNGHHEAAFSASDNCWFSGQVSPSKDLMQLQQSESDRLHQHDGQPAVDNQDLDAEGDNLASMFQLPDIDLEDHFFTLLH